MKKGLLAMFLVSLLVSGCAGMNKTQKGGVWGAGIGAAAGAVLGQAIGGDTESTLIGAGAGAVAGGLTGAAIGRYMDNQEKEMRAALADVESASVQRDQDVLAVTFKAKVLFDVDSAVLKPGAYDEVDRVAHVLNKYPKTTILVEGHTDSTGSEEYNQKLSVRRAKSVKKVLVARAVAPARIRTVGFGESKPIATNKTKAGRQMNRRVRIIIKPIKA